MTLPYALCKSTPTYFLKNEANIQIALGMIKDLQELIYIIATYNFVRSGERMIGAFAALQQEEKAAMICEQLKRVGMHVKGVNPFANEPVIASSNFRSPHRSRILNLWAALRPAVIQNFPAPPGISNDKIGYLDQVEELYLKDAYNSLSIEGYQVDVALIERVKNNHWNPDLHLSDQQERNALAARGYYEAFLEVKKSVAQVLNGENPGKMIERELQNWFQKLFSPNVNAGILQPNELIGFRKHQVYIRNSRHVPLPREALFDAMEIFFKCLQEESHPAVRAVLGHFIFVYIHPYMDGNGRLGRFIMNAMLASGGYPWTVIEVTNRTNYLIALEKASVDHDIVPFTLFIKKEMESDPSKAPAGEAEEESNRGPDDP
ncbi:MAG: Fic family protein [Verrucomicrobia bacterium]|nr:Fic family protein [Verrucomicrobiota bacterium]